jgi:hypothetical protein
MIAEICFTADWLGKKRKELRGVDPGLLERALHAFALLGHLAESNLKFVFKGGTSLLLHVPVIRLAPAKGAVPISVQKILMLSHFILWSQWRRKANHLRRPSSTACMRNFPVKKTVLKKSFRPFF